MIRGLIFSLSVPPRNSCVSFTLQSVFKVRCLPLLDTCPNFFLTFSLIEKKVRETLQIRKSWKPLFFFADGYVVYDAGCVYAVPGDICPGWGWGGSEHRSSKNEGFLLGSCFSILGSIRSGRVHAEPVVIIGQPVSNNA